MINHAAYPNIKKYRQPLVVGAVSLDKNILKFGAYRISVLHFGRLAYEFQSLDWFIKENLLQLKELAEMPPGDLNSEFNEIVPDDWLA